MQFWRIGSLLDHRISMISTFTPLVGASLLHVAAEFGNLKAARALVEMGADVNARAAFDAHGLNGHTPIFHTVNSNGNRSAPILDLLLEAGARPDVPLQGITWGRGIRVGNHVLRRNPHLLCAGWLDAAGAPA